MLSLQPIEWEPHKYQRLAIEKVIGNACMALLLDPGLGKTSIMLMAYKLLKAMTTVRSMLVIAPLRQMQTVWTGERDKWKNFKDLKIEILHGPEKDAALRRKADIYVINPEGLAWLLGQKNQAGHLQPGAAHRAGRWWDVLCLDESTRFKHTDTKRFKTLKPHLDKFRRRYILTGSPAPNGLLDLFGQIYCLDLGNALGRYITWYRTAYFVPTGFGGYTWVIQKGGEERIYKRLKPLSLRMAATDYLQLPELINNTVEVDLPPKAKAAYDQMEAQLIADLEKDRVVAANAAAATGKCRQIANGGIYHEGGERWTDLHEAKLDAVEEIIEELSGKPALVAYEYQHDLHRLRKRLGAETPYIGGGVSASAFREIERRWNNGELPVLLAQPQSVAHGLNLQGTGAAVIFHSITWNLEDYEQLIRRVWRQGQKERVFVHHIVARKTVDEAIMKLLLKKDRTQKALLSALKEYADAKT